MNDVSADLVEIVRTFLAAHRTMKRLFARYRSDELRFAQLQELIGDDESSVLFRLKERCHALFRPRDAESAMAMRREALFDLAVGSLFHEAMKFRENFYQREIYGPRVRALRSESAEESDALFREFEKILETVSERLAEGLQETEILIEQTGDQLRVLLAEQPKNGFVVRYLIENRELVEEVFAIPLDALLTEIAGAAAAGFELAGRSYLDSGFYRAPKAPSPPRSNGEERPKTSIGFRNTPVAWWPTWPATTRNAWRGSMNGSTGAARATRSSWTSRASRCRRSTSSQRERTASASPPRLWSSSSASARRVASA